MQRAAVIVLASVLAPQLAADARFQPAQPFTLEHGGTHWNVQMAPEQAGGYLVAWEGWPYIWLRHFDARGVPRADAHAVLKYDPPYVYLMLAGIAVGQDGRFALTYTREAEWPDEGAIAGFCLFAADDTVLRCDETPVSVLVFSVSLAFEPGGRFMFGWREHSLGASPGPHVFLRLYERDGSARSEAFVLDPDDPYATGPFLTHAGRDAFRVSWQDALHVHARRYDFAGLALDEPVDLRAAPACSDDAGHFAALWAGLDAQGLGAVFAQFHDVAGDARGTPVQVNQTPHSASALRAACDALGDVVIAWSAPTGLGQQVFARRYAGSGLPDSPEFRVDRHAGPPSSVPPLVAVVGARDGNFTIVMENPDGSAPDIAQPYVVQPPPRVKGDFDADGHADLVLRRLDDGSVRLWRLHEGVRLANTPLWPASPAPDWHIEGAADFDGDGHTDLLVRQPLTGDVRVWLLGGASGAEVLGQAALTGASLPRGHWEVAATADFDRDGQADLLWRDGVTQQLVVWLLHGMAWRATVVPDPDHAVDANWQVVAAGDLDGDGSSDIVWYNTTSGRVVQWLLDPNLVRTAGRFTDPPQAGDANWQVVAAGDYGFGVRAQAGTYDLLWRNATTGKLVAWFMDDGGKRTAGAFLTPSAPSDPLAWTVVGPR